MMKFPKFKFHFIANIIFWACFMTAFWGAFEMAFSCYEAGIISSPIWSGTLGFPVPHHYIIGFIGTAIAWIFFARREMIETLKLIMKKKKAHVESETDVSRLNESGGPI